MKPGRLHRSLHMLTLLLVTGGCTAVGPDYSGVSEAGLPEAWNHQFKTPTAVADLRVWWTNFDDPILTNLIEQARSGNPDLRIVLARVDEAEAQFGIAVAQYYPTVDSFGSSVQDKTSDNASIFPSRTEDYQTIGASLGWELDLFGRIRRQAEAAEANVEASIENYRDALVVLNAEIARTYVEVRTLQARLELANKNVANQRETVKVVNARYRAELTSELDVSQANQNLARSESVIPLLEAGLAKSVNRLAVLLGKRPGALDAELMAPAPIPPAPEELVIALPREVLRQRPDIRRAERQLAAQTANIGVAVADLYPRLSLSGTFGYSTASGDLLSAASNLWSFGSNLTWNIFDAGRRESQVAIQNARAEQARAVYEKTVLSAFEDVEAALINYAQEQVRLQALRASALAAEKTVGIAKSQYKNGLTNFQTVLDAERVLFADEDRLADSEGALVRYLVGIYRAMGGGWSVDSPPADRG